MEVKFVWYEIEDDGQLVRCGHCGRFRGTSLCVFITRDDGGPDTIAEKSCLGPKWLESHEKGDGLKKRTPAKLWQTRKPKLKLVHSKKPFRVSD